MHLYTNKNINIRFTRRLPTLKIDIANTVLSNRDDQHRIIQDNCPHSQFILRFTSSSGSPGLQTVSFIMKVGGKMKLCKIMSPVHSSQGTPQITSITFSFQIDLFHNTLLWLFKCSFKNPICKSKIKMEHQSTYIAHDDFTVFPSL